MKNKKKENLKVNSSSHIEKTNIATFSMLFMYIIVQGIIHTQNYTNESIESWRKTYSWCQRDVFQNFFLSLFFSFFSCMQAYMHASMQYYSTIQTTINNKKQIQICSNLLTFKKEDKILHLPLFKSDYMQHPKI